MLQFDERSNGSKVELNAGEEVRDYPPRKPHNGISLESGIQRRAGMQTTRQFF